MIRIKEYEKVAIAGGGGGDGPHPPGGGGDGPRPPEECNDRDSKKRLDRFHDKSPEEQKQSLNEQSQAAKDRQKLDRPNTLSNEGDPSKKQRQLERGYELERE